MGTPHSHSGPRVMRGKANCWAPSYRKHVRMRPHSLDDVAYDVPDTTSSVVLQGKSAGCEDICFIFIFDAHMCMLSVSCAVCVLCSGRMTIDEGLQSTTGASRRRESSGVWPFESIIAYCILLSVNAVTRSTLPSVFKSS
ncbi:hypothetical protein EDB86DRAFT_1759049 [Lactarius hatsudake]|nr:hypothetical protein EDB86DRAFT_1759049 [Lactarius hatsudake]